MYWDTSLFDERILLFIENHLKKTVNPSYPFFIHKDASGCAQVGFPHLPSSTQRSRLLVPALNKEDRAS